MILVTLPLLLVATLMGVGVISTISSLRACVVEPAGRLAILHTDWIAEAWAVTCGWRGADGTEELLVRNSVTEQKITLATARHLWPSSFESPNDGTLVITTPNQTDLIETHAPVDGLRVQFRYTPHDDPAFRQGFADWFNDPIDPKNREWYCKAWLPHLPPYRQKEDNVWYSMSFRGNKGKYCGGN